MGGPDVDPRSLRLTPKDEIDRAAFFHDIAYFRAGTGGYSGAKYNLKVRHDDLNLIYLAVNIMERYVQGDIDQVTGFPISYRTFQLAQAVYVFFAPIVQEKYRQSGNPTMSIPYPEIK